MAPRHVLAGFGIALVVGAVAAGLMMIGPPSEERARRLDAGRVADLQAIRYAVDEYARNHGRLPASLAELRREPTVVQNVRDPVTGREYGYRVLGDRAYQVCADFDRDSSAETTGTFWSHAPGPRCFDLQPAER